MAKLCAEMMQSTLPPPQFYLLAFSASLQQAPLGLEKPVDYRGSLLTWANHIRLMFSFRPFKATLSDTCLIAGWLGG